VFVPPLLVSILLYALANLNLGHTWQIKYHSLFIPLRQSTTNVSTHITNNISRFSRNSQVEIDKLRQENTALKTQLENLKSVSNLQKTYSQYLDSKYPSIPVKIVSPDPHLTITTPNITQIKIGSPLVDQQQFIGIVTNITNPIANVTTIFNSNIKLAVKTSAGSTGEIRYLNHKLQITNINSQQPLDVGDSIYTQSQPQIPENLYIGTIDQITTKSSDPLKSATVKLDYKLTSSSQLAVISL